MQTQFQSTSTARPSRSARLSLRTSRCRRSSPSNGARSAASRSAGRCSSSQARLADPRRQERLGVAFDLAPLYASSSRGTRSTLQAAEWRPARREPSSPHRRRRRATAAASARRRDPRARRAAAPRAPPSRGRRAESCRAASCRPRSRCGASPRSTRRRPTSRTPCAVVEKRAVPPRVRVAAPFDVLEPDDAGSDDAFDLALHGRS